MKHRVYHMLTSAICALVLLLSLIPAAYAADAPLQMGEIVGGDPNCAHDFDSLHLIWDEDNNCLEWHYGYWPCKNCDAKRVSYTIAPKQRHRFNPVTGLCIDCGTPDPDPNASYPGREPATPTTPDTPVDDPEPNLPTAPTSEKLYENGQVIGGILRCNHIFDNAHPINIPANCAGFGYLFWPCTRCNAYKVGVTYKPIGHSFNVNGVCTRCGASKASDKPETPTTPSTPSTSTKPDLPTAATSEQIYQISQNLGGDPNCTHSFDSYSKITVRATCTGYGYDFWPCRKCDAYHVGAVLYPYGHQFGSDGVCTRCGASGAGDTPTTPTTPTTPSSPPTRNYDFGEYTGVNKTGEMEFVRYLKAGEKETQLPLVNTQGYDIKITSSAPNIVSVDGLTFQARAQGNAKLYYVFTGSGGDQVKVVVNVTVMADSSSTAGSDIKRNPNFGTYIGTNSDGVEEFKLTLTAGTKETGRPLTSTQSYRINTWSSDAKVIAWDGMTILAKGAGTATLTYKYVIDGVEQTKAIVYATVEAGAETPAAGGSDGDAYSKRAGNLGPRPGGGYDLIWTSGNQTIGMDGKVVSDTRQTKITSFDKDFNEIAVHPIKFELNTLKGGYWGEKYNYLIFTQNNDEETDGKEVLRLVKYTKDWERLGAASLYGKSSNTSEAVRSANLSFAESGDMLYVHTAHKIYRLSDGLQHQTNMTFSVRQSDMTVTDGRFDISNASTGYCSHSFAQDVLVDQSGNIVTLDQGDAHPRAAMLFKYASRAGGDKFTGTGTYTLLQKWPGATGENNTGSKTCALAETSQGYLSAYVDSGKGSGYNSAQDHYDVYLAFNAKNNFTSTQSRRVASGSASENPVYVYLFPSSPEGGTILWFSSQKGQYNWMSNYTAYCAAYSADGSVGSAAKLTSFTGAPFNGPCYDGSRIVWTDQANAENGMSFYVLENGKLTVTKAKGELAGKASATTPTTPTNPTTPSGGKTTFTDVPAGAYYTDAVAWALEKGITAGTSATSFSPYAACTRGQVATFLWRAKGEPEPVTKNNPFRDVKASDYYYKAVLWAYENGVTAGTSATTFGPNDTCTNGHVVTFLWRANGEPAASGTSSLAQSFPRDFYTGAVAWADTSGLLKDTGAAFDPRSQSPRANIVTYLYRDLAK